MEEELINEKIFRILTHLLLRGFQAWEKKVNIF